MGRMGRDEKFLKETFGIKEGNRTRIPLPGAQAALKGLAKVSARRKQKLSKQDQSEILALASLGKDPEQIADQKKFALFAVRKVIAESKKDDKGKLAADWMAETCGVLYDKIHLLLEAINPDNIQKAAEGGKIRDIAQSAVILSQVRANMRDSLMERVGVDQIQNSSGIEGLVDSIFESLSSLAQDAKRKDLVKKAMDTEYLEVSPNGDS